MLNLFDGCCRDAARPLELQPPIQWTLGDVKPDGHAAADLFCPPGTNTTTCNDFSVPSVTQVTLYTVPTDWADLHHFWRVASHCGMSLAHSVPLFNIRYSKIAER